MTVKMILAVDLDNAIGFSNGDLPWKLPEDMRRFKELTSGHDIFMGRKTFESLKRPKGLPNRKNYVLTSDHAKVVCDGGPTAVDQLEGFIQFHQRQIIYENQLAQGGSQPDLWIIGGATIYDQAIEEELVDEIYLTLVGVHSNADVKLKFDLTNWKFFVLRQAQIGVQWNLQQIQWLTTETNIPLTFITLKKIQ